jgi:hypothetical protein
MKVIDDFTAHPPIIARELDVIDTYLGQIISALFPAISGN